MKYLTLALLGIGLIFAPVSALAQETNAVDDVEVVGALPGTFGYFFKRLREDVGLAFTTNPEKKADRISELADKRLSEIEALVENGDTKRVDKALERYESRMERVLARAENGEDKREEFLERIGEQSLRHQDRLAVMHERLPEQARLVVEQRITDNITRREVILTRLPEERRARFDEKHAERIEKAEDRLSTLRENGIKIPTREEAVERATERRNEIDERREEAIEGRQERRIDPTPARTRDVEITPEPGIAPDRGARQIQVDPRQIDTQPTPEPVRATDQERRQIRR